MKLKGLEKFREKLPLLAGKRIILLPIYILVIAAVFFLSISFIYKSPQLSNPQSLVFPLLGILILELLAFFCVAQFWVWKEKLKAKHPETSYQRVIFIGFAGITVVILLAFNNLTPLRWFNPDIWKEAPFATFGTPFTDLLKGNWIILDICRYLLGFSLLALGILTMVRSLLTFGIDYMALVYLYFPEESEIQDHHIYSILRHPAYSAVITVCFAGFVINFTLFNLLYLLAFLAGFSIHILVIEERELIQRFGESYISYRKSVPAIIVPPKNWNAFFAFLRGKTSAEESGE